MIGCSKFRAAHSRFEGEAVRLRRETHLGQCASCRAEDAFLRAARRLIVEGGAPDRAAEHDRALSFALRPAPRGPAVGAATRSPQWVLWLCAATVASSVAVFLMVCFSAPGIALRAQTDFVGYIE